MGGKVSFYTHVLVKNYIDLPVLILRRGCGTEI